MNEKHTLKMAVVLILMLLVGFLTAVAIGGCAFTSIETPIGKYVSTRDSSLDSLEIQIIEHPDGRKETIVKVGGASGQASPVVQAQAEVIRAAMEAAFTLGKAAP